jgi:ElaB/YqjD/DUF883 family membrane-anchored ribosome-binding protein
MNSQPEMKNVNQDEVNGKKDINTLFDGGVFQLSRIEGDVSQTIDKSKGDLTTWVEDGASQLSKGFEKLKGNVKEIGVDVAATVKKDVGHGLSNYNAKAQKVADKVFGSFGKKATRYPWVAISTALAVGFFLGGLIKPTRKFMKFFK